MRLGWWILSLLVVSAQAAEIGSLRYPGELKQKPFLDAPKVVDLQANAALEIIARQGAWMQVKTSDGHLGWVKMLSVRTGSSDTKAGSSGSGLLALASAFKTGSSGSTATTGVKGLNDLTADRLQGAEPNMAELAKLDAFASTQSDAAKFAASAKLVAQKDLPYLAKPDDKQQ